MRVPAWARWALAAVLVLGVATAGVAANLAVLGSGTEDTRLGTLSAGSLALAASPGVQPPRPSAEGGEKGGAQVGEAGEHHGKGGEPDDD